MDRWQIAIPAMALTLLASASGGVGAQETQVPPPGTSPEEIRRQIDALGGQAAVLQRLQASGMSVSDIRRRLEQAGYDPTTLDPYLVERPGDQPAPTPTPEAMSALQALGVLRARYPDTLTASADSMRPGWDGRREPMPDSIAIERERGLRVFGLEVFHGNTDEFQPIATGPVPADYVIGPGDELVLMLTGDVEQAYTLPVTREGFTVIPQVGEFWVNGLTLGEVRERLYTRLGQAYSGISRGPEATTHFQVALGQLRPNPVFVTGEVEQPGSYLVSSVASVLTALYRGGGPMPNGSFRDVRVMRNGELVERADLYAYLVQGNNLAGVRLQPGDVVFVPSHRAHVSIKGEVVRPAIYEVLPDETLLDLVEFAGGLNAPAHLRRARITRILPPAERTVPGVDRTVIDVDLAEIVRYPSRAPDLAAGDAVEIFPVRSEIRNTVSIQGGVWHEGTFHYRRGMRLWDLVGMADGLQEDAYAARAHIIRMDRRDSTLSMIPVSLDRAPDGSPVDNPELREFDTVRVYEESRFTTTFPVTITGEIREPVQDTFYEGMTLRDLILKAGGLRPTADLEVEIARLARPDRSDRNEIAEVLRVRVDSSYFVSDQDRRLYLGGAIPDNGPAAEFELRPYDRVRVRQLPDLEFQRTVRVAGEVRYPGTYAMERKDERLLSILGRAGGLSTTAFPGGFQLYRDTTLVNVDLEEALDDPDGAQNVTLLSGDSLFIPEYNPIVLVKGAVNSPTPVAVLYKEGADLDYYIANAGGYAPRADEDHVHIRYANGEGAIADQVLLFKRKPRPLAGSVVNVPARDPSERFDWMGTVRDFAGVIGTVVTTLLLVDRL